MKTFNDILYKAKTLVQDIKLVIACPYDENILKASKRIFNEGIANIVLIGNITKIKDVGDNYNISLDSMELINKDSDQESLEKACEMLAKNDADVVVKGMVQTANFMKSILSHKELRKSKLLTHVSIIEVPGLNKLIFVSDPSIVIEPNLSQKMIIIDNALELMEHLDIVSPKVAIISSTENPNINIQSSIDGEMITKIQKEELRWEAEVHGPLAIDVAVSSKAAKSKNITNSVAGNADLLIMPNLDSGNIFCKGLTYLGGLKSTSIVMGARKPIVLTSRSAGVEERFNAMCLASLLAKNVYI